MKLTELPFSEQTIVAILAKLHQTNPEVALEFRSVVGEDVWNLVTQKSFDV